LRAAVEEFARAGCGKVEESVEDSQATVFKGSYRHRIDAKGRLPVPAAFRRLLGEAASATVVLTPLDQCLAAYPSHEWSRLESSLAALPPFSKPVKALSRLLSSRAVDCRLDVQGRILLPSVLRAAAQLEREAVVAGVLNRFEIWEPRAWSAFLADSERVLDDATLGVAWPLLPPEGPPAAAGRGRPQGKPKR
jgi:transcriptional regulator MraZ